MLREEDFISHLGVPIVDHSVPTRSLGRRVLAAATALVMAVGLAGATASPALAAGTGVISGTVTGTGNAPLQGISVQIFRCDPNFNPLTQQNCWTGVTTGQILTAANGSYSIPNLDPGQYTAAFFPQSGANLNYAYEFWNNKTSLETATAFSVANGAATTVSPNLQLGATISGSVFGPGSTAAPLTMVSATNTATPNQSSHATVQSNGSYQFIGLQPGEYYLWAGPDNSLNNPSTLVREYYDNKPDAASATRFTVGSGQTFTANFELANGGIISGNVKNTSSANLPNIDVTIFSKDDYGYWQQIKTTTTDASGNYSLAGLSNRKYVVRFSDFGGTYGQRYAANTVDRATATEYTVGPGVNATGVNVVLSAGGGITGVVTQTPTGGSAAPSASAYVSVIKVTAGGVHETVESVQTNASGVYTVTGLAPGNYTIQTAGDNAGNWAQTFRGGYYPDQATTVAINTTTVNAGTTNVVPGTTLRGNYTDTNLAPVPSVRVKILYERSPNNWVAPPPAGGAGDVNLYIVSRLPPGRYIVYFEDSATTDKYVTQYYNNKPTFGTATVIEAPNGGVFQNISAKMTKTPHPALTASAAVSPASPNGSNGWYKTGNVTVTLTSGGGTVAPDKLEYKIAPATTWSAYTAPIVVSTNGSTAITYRAVEEGLQNSAEGTVTIKRDLAVPTVTSSLSGRTVTVTSADTGSSGVALTEYKLGSGAWTPYTAPVNVGNAAVTVQYRATDTAGNVSAVGSLNVPAVVVTLPEPVRVDGAARWNVATNISQRSYPTGTDVVYVTSGLTFPDALSAGPAAARDNAPVLLVTPTSISQTVIDEIDRLNPTEIVVIGGLSTVSAAVYDQLDGMVPTIRRIEGGNRYEVSRAVARDSFPSATRAYIANGANFPDALAAGGAAGVTDAPIILVSGAAADLDAATATLLDDLGVTEITVLGGTASVSAGIEADLGAIATTERIQGANRYEGAVAINTDAFTAGADAVILATGENFPDALAGSAWAAKLKVPLYVVKGTCVPAAVMNSINAMEPSEVYLLGGANTLSAAVEDYAICP